MKKQETDSDSVCWGQSAVAKSSTRVAWYPVNLFRSIVEHVGPIV